MTTIRRTDRTSLPSAFTSHLMVERIAGGYQASGVTTVNQYTKHLSSVVYRSFDDALRQAKAWSIEHGIPEIL